MPATAMAVGQMRLAGAGTTNEYRVLRRIGKRQCRQLLDQLLVGLGRLKVKPRQIAVYRELGCIHRVAHRPHGAIRVFSLQQVFDQPSGRLR